MTHDSSSLPNSCPIINFLQVESKVAKLIQLMVTAVDEPELVPDGAVAARTDFAAAAAGFDCVSWHDQLFFMSLAVKVAR